MKRTNLLKVIIVALLFVFFSQRCKDRGPSYDEPELDVPYVPTPMEAVNEMLRLAEIEEGDVLLDLGCGDGRIPVTAAAQYNIKAFGIDLNPVRIKESQENAKEAGVNHLVKFIEQDLYETDLTEASVITMYLLPSVNLKLRSKILSDVKPGTRIISHDFDMGEWPPDDESMVFAEEEAHIVYYWMVPANLTGEWALKLSDSSLEVDIIFNQVFQFAQGEVSPEKKDWKITEEVLTGDKISFNLLTPDSVWLFEGSIKGDIMGGDVQNGKSGEMISWEAFRNPKTKQPLEKAALT